MYLGLGHTDLVKRSNVKVTVGNDRKTLWTPYKNQWREFRPILVTDWLVCRCADSFLGSKVIACCRIDI